MVSLSAPQTPLLLNKFKTEILFITQHCWLLCHFIFQTLLYSWDTCQKSSEISDMRCLKNKKKKKTEAVYICYAIIALFIYFSQIIQQVKLKSHIKSNIKKTCSYTLQFTSVFFLCRVYHNKSNSLFMKKTTLIK